MTVEQLVSDLSLRVFAMPSPERQICGGYVGDLLSWVMGRAKADDAWVTIMTNANTVAVATLTDVSVVIIAENSEISPDIVKLAEEKGVNLLGSSLSSYDLCVALGQRLP